MDRRRAVGGDSSPPLPSQTPAPPPPTTDPSPPLPRENQTTAQWPPLPPAPAPAPTSPSPPAPVSKEAKSEPDADEAAGESENMTLAHALTQTEEAIPPPPPAAAMAEPPAGSPQKESALTIAKLLSGEDPAATEGKPAADKVAPAVVMSDPERKSDKKVDLRRKSGWAEGKNPIELQRGKSYATN